MKIEINIANTSPLSKEEVVSCWHEVFHNSSAHAQTIMGTDHFSFRLAKDKSEVPNGIMDNDPLSYRASIDGSSWSESMISMLVKPTTVNLVYSSVKLRKKTVKNVDHQKLVARFREVRKFVMDNAHNLKNPLFDISNK